MKVSRETKENKKQERLNFIKKFKKNSDYVDPFKENEIEFYKKKKKFYVKYITLAVISIILLILLSNRTFFRENYKTSKIDLNVPLLSFFVKDDGNELVLKTLRKTRYVQEFFDDKLSNMKRYRCNDYSFYYDDTNNTAIYSIDVDKSFIIKTITVRYANGDPDCLCDYGTDANLGEIEKVCRGNL